jgi:hypothetical protein
MPFTAVRIAEASTEAAASTAAEQPRAVGGRSGLIEISLVGGRRVRVDASVDAAALARVLDVLDPMPSRPVRPHCAALTRRSGTYLGAESATPQ